jgi:hypothetical protein
MTKQTEALRMANTLRAIGGYTDEAMRSLVSCEEIANMIEALAERQSNMVTIPLDKLEDMQRRLKEPTVAELNDEYLRDTHVEGLSTNSKANEIIKTQHWLCLDGQMVVAQLYNLVEILNDPMKAYPHNFSTPAKANALLFGLCQEAADEIERLKAETQEPVHTNGDRTMSMKDRNFTSEGNGYIQDNNFDFDAGLRIGGDFVNDERDQYAQMICNALNTTPSREWQSLSDEEIIYMYNEPSSDAEMLEFAREFEAKLREKNEK